SLSGVCIVPRRYPSVVLNRDPIDCQRITLIPPPQASATPRNDAASGGHVHAIGLFPGRTGRKSRYFGGARHVWHGSERLTAIPTRTGSAVPAREDTCPIRSGIVLKWIEIDERQEERRPAEKVGRTRSQQRCVKPPRYSSRILSIAEGCSK